MSEYMEKFAVSRLIGAPPGYVGYDEGGQLTEAVRRRPYQVVLLDEIEKAHPDVFNVLLQVLDDGRLTDSQGRTVDFKNTVIIMTSNIGSSAIAASGARSGDAAYEEMKREVTESLQLALPARVPQPGRRGHRLPRPDRGRPRARIVDLLVADLAQRLAEQDIVLELTPAAQALLVREGTDPAFGARPLKRTIQRLVENPLARALVAGEFRPGDRIVADADPVSGTLVFSTESATVVTEPAAQARRPDAAHGAGRPGAGRRPAELGRSAPGATGPAGGADPGVEPAHRRHVARAYPPATMRFDDVLARLEAMPELLPAPAEILMPVLAGGSDLRRPQTPPPGRPGRPAAVLVLVYPDDDGRGPGRPDRAGEPRRPPQRRGQLPGRQGRARGRRPRRDRPARGDRGDRPRPGRRGGPARRPARTVLDPGQRLPGDPDRRRRAAAADSWPPPRPRSRGSSSRRCRRFLPDAPIAIVERQIGDWPLRYGAYDVDGLSVWGATARILSQLGRRPGRRLTAAPMAGRDARYPDGHDTDPPADAQGPLRDRLAGARPEPGPDRLQHRQPDLPRLRVQAPRHARRRHHPGPAGGADDRPGRDQRALRRLRRDPRQRLPAVVREVPPAAHGVIEGLTIPVTVLGVGLQAPIPYESGANRAWDDSVKAFVRAVLDRSPSIGVRGEYTQDYLNQLGFKDVEVIGCPSMFLHGDQLTVTKRTPTLERDARVAINITTRVGPVAPLVTSHLEHYPNLEYIVQDRVALNLMLWGEDDERAKLTHAMPIHRSHPLFRDDKALCFVDPWPWLRAHALGRLHVRDPHPRQHRGAPRRAAELRPGPRHADAGAGALLRDPASSRDRPAAGHGRGPAVRRRRTTVRSMAGHARRFRTFIDYVERQGLRHVFQPGEDPTAFDRKMATTDFPPPARTRNHLAVHRAKRRVGRMIRRVWPRGGSRRLTTTRRGRRGT